MKTTSKFILTILCITFLTAGFSSCNKEDAKEKEYQTLIVGIWERTTSNFHPKTFYYEFKVNGTGEMHRYIMSESGSYFYLKIPFTWSIKGNSLQTTSKEGASEESEVEKITVLDNKNLTLQHGNDDFNTFVRVDKVTAPGK